MRLPIPRSSWLRRAPLMSLAGLGLLFGFILYFVAPPAHAEAATTYPQSPRTSAAARRADATLCPANANLRSAQTTSPAQFAAILNVPSQYPTIQAAVNAAQANDLVLVAPGVYHEAVIVCNADITIAGASRNTTILDGQSQLINAFTVLADNVVIENMTAHHYKGNGFFWTYQTGYRGSYLTAYDNGDYGIYAYNSRLGEFNDDYASGSPDSGFYIGQCFPCDAIVTRVHSEWNGLGYSGTNAGGNIVLEDSEWDMNSAGIVPNTLDSEQGPPQRGGAFINNYVHDNGNPLAPYTSWAHIPFGTGILVAGGDKDYVAYNKVVNNPEYGIAVTANLDQNFWLATGNVVEHNTVKGSGLADLMLSLPNGPNNCFSDNQATTTTPAFLEESHACGTPFSLVGGGDFGATLRLFTSDVNTGLNGPGPSFNPPDWRKAPTPPAQTEMPSDPMTPGPLMLDAMPTSAPFANNFPVITNQYTPNTNGDAAMFQPLGFSGFSIVQFLLSFYGDALLFALYGAWLALAFVELAHRDDLKGGMKLLWGIIALALPIVGPILYYFLSGSKLSVRFRLALVVGAPILLLAITVLLMVVASYTLL